MSIADKITSIEGHLTDDYEGLENLGADLTNVNKNIQNIRTCLDNIYTNLPKTTGEGSNLSLTTLKGRINVDDILGDTEQDTTNGYQLLDLTLAKLKTYNTSGTWNNNVYTISGLTITINDDMSIKVNGTTTAQVGLFLAGGAIPYPTGTYYLSGAINGSNDTYDVRIFNYNGTSAVAQCFTGTKQVAIVNNSQSFNMALIVRNGVTCNNTMFYPMLSTTNTSDYEPYTNGASPNPTYPQDINVVTGTQEAFVSNSSAYNKDFKDLPNTYQAVKYIQSDGNQYFYLNAQWKNTSKIEAIIGTDNEYNNNVIFSESSSASVWIGFSNSTTMSGGGFTNLTITPQATTISYKTLSTITFSYNLTSTGNIRWGTYATITYNKTNRIASLKVYDTDNTLVRNMVACYRKSDNIIGMYDLVNNIFYTNEGSGNFTKGDDLQSQTKTLHLGDIELAKIGTYQDRIFESSGKNLFNKEDVESGKYYNVNGAILTSPNWNIAQIEVQPNTNYYLSGNNYNNETAGIVLLDESKNFISLVSSYKNVHLITTTATTKYIGLSIANYSGSSDMNSIMLNLGSTALPYEPYGSDKWYIEKNYEKITLANYTWLQNTTSTTGKNRYYTNGLASIIEKTATNGSKTTKGLLCNILTESTPNNNYLCTNNTICSTTNGQLYVYIESISGETGTTALMNLFTSTNAYALIPLATTTYTEITNETLLNELNELEKMMSYNGQTNISVSGNLPMILDITALKGE